MKIAVWHNLPSGGGKRALYYHVKGLVERGHTVEAWCPSSADTSYLSLGEFAIEHLLPFDWKPNKHRNRYARYFDDYRNINSLIRALDEHARQFADQINHHGFDLLFANTCRFFHTPFVARYVNLPKVLYLQEPYRPLYEALPNLPWLALPQSKDGWHPLTYSKNLLVDLVRTQAHRIQAREELQNARSFDALLVNSYFSRESVLRAYGLNAQVCYLGVDTTKFVNRHQPRENFLVGLGSFVFEKNIRFVLDAVAQLQAPRPLLVWIGNMADTRLLEELKQHAHAQGVCFEPHASVGDDEIVDILNRAAMLVYAPRLEPFGYAVLEANACGLPVVAVAEGGVRETVIDGMNGLLVEPEAQVMAAAIQRLLDNPELARGIGEKGYEYVQERWSLAVSIDRLEQRFKRVLGATSSSLQ